MPFCPQRWAARSGPNGGRAVGRSRLDGAVYQPAAEHETAGIGLVCLINVVGTGTIVAARSAMTRTQRRRCSSRHPAATVARGRRRRMTARWDEWLRRRGPLSKVFGRLLPCEARPPSDATDAARHRDPAIKKPCPARLIELETDQTGERKRGSRRSTPKRNCPARTTNAKTSAAVERGSASQAHAGTHFEHLVNLPLASWQCLCATFGHLVNLPCASRHAAADARSDPRPLKKTTAIAMDRKRRIVSSDRGLALFANVGPAGCTDLPLSGGATRSPTIADADRRRAV